MSAAEVDGFGRPFRVRVVAASRAREITGPTGLRRLEAGVYQTADGAFGIVRIDSLDEWDALTSEGWAIVDGDAYDGAELPTIYRTKAAAVAALPAIRQELGR